MCRQAMFYHGYNICNIFELKIIIISVMVFSSPKWMNRAIYGVLIVEQMINICGRWLIYIVIYIRSEY